MSEGYSNSGHQDSGRAAGMTDHTIEMLSNSLCPVKRQFHPVWRILPWILACAGYVAFIVDYIGVRPDAAIKMTDTAFLLEIILGGGIFLSSIVAAAFLLVPDQRGQGWLVIVPWVLAGVLVLWSGIRAISEGLALPAPHWDHCFADALFLGTVPAAFIMFVSIQGYTTKPRMMAAMHMLSVAGLGYVALRFTCMMDTVGHGFVYHLVPFVLFGGLLGVLARYVFRW